MSANNYTKFAKHYDSIMGDRVKTVRYIEGLISVHNPNAKKLLELACGTGEILKHISKKYNLYGLDLSSDMIKIAKRKVPKAKFFVSDMTKFNVKERFDVILCLFDSINHVIDFNLWQAIFYRVSEHLNDEGIFIFDINTIHKLQDFSKSPPWITKFGDNFLIMSIEDFGKNLTNWNVKIFEKVSGTKYNLIEENIKEISFPLNRIKRSLQQNFQILEVLDSKNAKVSKKSSKIYFICKKKRLN